MPPLPDSVILCIPALHLSLPSSNNRQRKTLGKLFLLKPFLLPAYRPLQCSLRWLLPCPARFDKNLLPVLISTAPSKPFNTIRPSSLNSELSII